MIRKMPTFLFLNPITNLGGGNTPNRDRINQLILNFCYKLYRYILITHFLHRFASHFNKEPQLKLISFCRKESSGR